ncbi:MAG: hypothetical protein ABSA83_24365, partial [Verrucomicrobiota bacterium]
MENEKIVAATTQRRQFLRGTAPAVCWLLAVTLPGGSSESQAQPMTIGLVKVAGIANPQPEIAPPLTGVLRIMQDPIGNQLQAAFIWADAPKAGDKQGVAVGFRKSFNLEKQPASALLHLFADARYVLWANGTYVDRGPARFQPNGPEYDSLEIAPF